VVELIHRSFLLPSCKVDLSRYHPRACLQYYIHRCLGPCVQELTTPEIYKSAVRDAQLLLEGRHAELERTLTARMIEAAEAQLFEAAAKLRDQLATVQQLQEKQRAATAELDDDADVFGYHFEDGSLAVNLFHVRAGKIVDRREFFWEDLPELLEAADPESQSTSDAQSPFDAALYQGTTLVVPKMPQKDDGALAPAGNAGQSEDLRAPSIPRSSAEWVGDHESHFHAGSVFSALLKQLYIDAKYVPRSVLLPADFDDREALARLLTERTGHRIEIAVPQRGEKRSLVDLAGQNAKQSYIQRFRVLEPSRKAIQEALAEALMLAELPRRIECFDISHIQGAETVASLVVWEDGKMNKQLYRKFKIKTVEGVDDFASMREVVGRRYKRLQDEKQPMPSLILVDGGLGQLHAAAEALEFLGLTTQPLASIAKREEVIYLYGNEDEPVVLDRHSPVLHLVQLIRDESHRFAVGYHRQRRAMRDRESEILLIPGVGPQTRQRLLTHFGSLREVREATAESLAAVVPRKTAETIWRHFHEAQAVE
jgi:excinuclease ABC subunit C